MSAASSAMIFCAKFILLLKSLWFLFIYLQYRNKLKQPLIMTEFIGFWNVVDPPIYSTSINYLTIILFDWYQFLITFCHCRNWVFSGEPGNERYNPIHFDWTYHIPANILLAYRDFQTNTIMAQINLIANHRINATGTYWIYECNLN